MQRRPAKKTTKELLVEHSRRLADFEPAFREESRQLFHERTRYLLEVSLVFYPPSGSSTLPWRRSWPCGSWASAPGLPSST